MNQAATDILTELYEWSALEEGPEKGAKIKDLEKRAKELKKEFVDNPKRASSDLMSYMLHRVLFEKWDYVK